MTQPVPAADLLYGNAAIAAFLGMTVRQVKARTAKGAIPSFRIDGRIVARRQRLREWLAELEAGRVAVPSPALFPEDRAVNAG